MRVTTLGAIAIASTLTFACSSTTTTKSTGDSPTSDGPGDGWKPPLSLAQAGAHSTVIAALGKSGSGGGGMRLRSGGSGGGTCGGLSTGDASCDSCLDASCCAESTACVADADCTALITCGDACSDDACISACFSSHPTGAALLDSISTCLENSCMSACGGGTPPPPPSTSSCGFGSGDPACDSCLDTNCCGVADTCLNDPDCTTVMDCERMCSDAACAAACESAHPTGASELNALVTCGGTTCGSACGGSTPPSSGSASSCGLTSGDPTCDACLDGSCCTQTTACLGDTDCVALINCYDACTDAACASACDTAHPTGSTKLGDVFSCAQTSCASTCGL